MASCLTEHEIDTAMLVAFAGGSMATIALIACVLAWLPSRGMSSRTPSYVNGIGPLLGAGCLVLLMFNGQFWLVAVVVATLLIFFPVVLVLRRRESAFSAGVELSPAWRRANSAIKYGGPVLAVAGAIVAVGSLARVLPAELC